MHNIGNLTCIAAEIFALNVLLTDSLHLQNVEIETDSQAVIHLLRRNGSLSS